jgi:hypothetical protein
MSRRLAALAGVGILVGAGGFLLGSLVADEDPSPSGSVPTRIQTRSSATRIPTLGSVEQIPAIDLPPQASSAADGETATSVAESPVSEPEEEASSPPSSSSSQPEVTVAPTE